MVFKLVDFDDFTAVAVGCDHIFYMVREKKAGTVELVAYAGRVWWAGRYKSEDDPECRLAVDQLGEMNAKQIVEDTDLEAVFR